SDALSAARTSSARVICVATPSPAPLLRAGFTTQGEPYSRTNASPSSSVASVNSCDGGTGRSVAASRRCTRALCPARASRTGLAHHTLPAGVAGPAPREATLPERLAQPANPGPLAEPRRGIAPQRGVERRPPRIVALADSRPAPAPQRASRQERRAPPPEPRR